MLFIIRCWHIPRQIHISFLRVIQKASDNLLFKINHDDNSSHESFSQNAGTYASGKVIKCHSA